MIILFYVVFLLSIAFIPVNGQKKVIIDVDVGVDDAHALVIFLWADSKNIIKIEAIVCSLGNTDLDNTCKNIIKVLETAGRLDIPIYRGAYYPLVAEYEKPTWDGEDGFGDIGSIKIPDLSLIKSESPIEILYKLVNKYPGEITMIVLGATTNAALPMRVYPDYLDKIKDIFMMGGNYEHGAGYIPEAEFNFRVDPEATYIIFENAQSKPKPITLIPIEICKDTHTTYAWRFDVLGNVSNPLCNLLQRVDYAISSELDPETVWVPYDAFLAFAFLYPDRAYTKSHNATIELVKPEFRGELIITENGGNVNVITQFIEEDFRKVMIDACMGVCENYSCVDIY